MAAVHAVEIADRQRAAVGAGKVEAAVDAHGPRLSRRQAEQPPVQRQVGGGGAVPVELRGVGADGVGAARLAVSRQALCVKTVSVLTSTISALCFWNSAYRLARSWSSVGQTNVKSAG